MPGHSRPHVHFGPTTTQNQESQQRDRDEVALLRFPNAKNILWDHTRTGSAVQVGLVDYRKPKLCIAEKVLRLAQRHLDSLGEESSTFALQGSLTVDEDGEGVTFVLDRFDPGGGGPISTNGLTPGDISVPFQMSGNSKSERGSSLDDYYNALKLLKAKCCSKDKIELSTFLLTKGWCSYYTSGEKSVHHLEFDVVTMATEFNVSPISPVPIVPTALSKNLSGPMSMSHLQGEPKTGYLTMDHTRKVLLVLESDPKVFSLPLVGIWISGIPYVYSPFVWACFLRFIYNSSIHDRVCTPPEPFLMVLYNPVHSRPEFYEVSTSSGSSKMEFELYSGYEVVSLPKMATCSSQNMIGFDISAVENGKKRDIFDGALYEFGSAMPETPSNGKLANSGSDEITPRSRPAPHKSQVPKVMPLVPEVSLLFGEDGQSGILTNSGPRKPPITQGQPNGVHHIQDFNNTPILKSTPNTMPSSQHSVPVFSTVNSTPSPGLPHHFNSAPNLQQLTPQTLCTGPCCANRPGLSQQYVQNSLPHHGAFVRKSGPQPPPSQSNVPQQTSHLLSNPSVPQHMYAHQGHIRQPQPLRNGQNVHNFQPSAQMNSQPNANMNPHPGTHMNSQPGAQMMPSQHTVAHNGNYNNNMHPHNNAMHPQQMFGRPSYPSPYNSVDCQYNTPSNGHMRSYSGPALNHPRHHEAQIPKTGGQRPARKVAMSSTPAASHQNGTNTHHHTGGNVHTQMTAQQANMAPANADVVTPASSLSPRHNSSGSTNSRSSGQADSTGRSSDDSGLSVTPERPRTGSNQDLPQQSNMEETKPSQLGNSAINWNQVPPEVYQLLLQQDAQLKQLQAQIQMLIQNQSTSTQNTTTTELCSTVTSEKATELGVSKENTTEVKSQTCTTGTNTSLFMPIDQHKHSMSVQTSPQKKVMSPRGVDVSNASCGRDPPLVARQFSEDRSSTSHHSYTSQHSTSSSGGGDPRTPAEIRHRGALPMNSTEREDFDMEISQGDFLGVARNVELHNATMNSIQSDMIVDMPSYHSSPTRSQASPTATGSGDFSVNSRSPISASMCGDGPPDSEESEEEGEEQDEEGAGQLSADNKEYYDKLMNNIHRLLHQTEDTNTVGDDTRLTQSQSLPTDTLQQSILLGQYLNSIRMDGDQNPVETTFIPKINYMSMMFDSDSDCSMEINAMAMKYLKDEQLTQLNKLQTQSRLKGNKVNKENQRLAMLRRVLSDGSESTPNVTTLGMSPNDMTFATRKYMEKHGLLSDSDTNSTTSTKDTYDDSYQLKTNFSIAPDSPGQITHEVLETPSTRKSRSPFLDSLRSQNMSGKTRTTNLDSYSSPFNNRTNSPIQNIRSHNSSKNTQSPLVNSYNTSGKSRTSAGQFTPSRTTPQINRSKDRSENRTPKEIQNLQMSHGTPQHYISKDSGTESAAVLTPRDRNPLSPRSNNQQPPMMRNGTPSPVRQVDDQHKVLSPVIPETIPERATPVYDDQNHRHQLADGQDIIHRREDEDKILDITRLKLLPKLL